MTNPSDVLQKAAEAIRQYAPQHLQEELVSLLRPAVTLHLTNADDADLVLASSKFGGAPDVPASFDWPTWYDKPLGFLAQINLEDVTAFDLHGVLPTRGLLSFFYDGGEGHNKEGNRVYWFKDTKSLARSQPPVPPLVQTCRVVPSFYVELLHFIDNHWGRDQWREILNATTANDFYPDRPYDSENKMLGYGDDYGRNSVVPDFDVQYDQNRERVDPKTVDYQLLLQVVSDGRVDAMWSDDGTLNFMIRNDHLAARRFDETQLTGTNG